MKISIPTNDQKTIFPGMLGRSKGFAIYALDDSGHFRFIEWRENPYENTLQHNKTLDVYHLIDDCKVIIAAKIGKNGRAQLKEMGVELYFTQGEITSALDQFLKDRNHMP